MKVSFYLKPNKTRERASVYANFSWTPAKGQNLRYQAATGITINPKDFDKSKGEIKRKYTPEFLHYRKKLDDIKNFAETWYYKTLLQGGDIRLPDVKQAITNFLAGKQPTASFEGALQDFLQFHVDKQSSAGTLYRIRSLQNLLQSFASENGQPLCFDDFDKSLFHKFSLFLSNAPNARARFGSQMTDATVNGFLRLLKMFLKWSYECHLHTNAAFATIKIATPKPENHITLTADEIEAIAALPLEPYSYLDQARDVFFFQLETAQRITDILNFKPEQVQNGIWQFVIGKTQTIHQIALRAKANEVLNKYNGSLPKLNRMQYNRYLKELGRQAGINEMVTITRFVARKPTHIQKPKYELLASHTLRRTTITQLVQKGLPESQIKKLTGQKTTKIVQNYDQSTPEDIKKVLDDLSF
jgi:site-specific recombinase XerD